MTREPINWIYRNDWKPFPCFSKGCTKEATQVVRIEYGPAHVQLCLCDDCSDENPETMMNAVRSRQERAVN